MTDYIERICIFLDTNYLLTDIFCLQEINPDLVDKIRDSLGDYDFQSIFQEDIPNVATGKRSFLAIAFRNDIFTQVKQKKILYTSTTGDSFSDDMKLPSTLSSGQMVRKPKQSIMSGSGKHLQFIFLSYQDFVILVCRFS
jgi:hypothetical protein